MPPTFGRHARRSLRLRGYDYAQPGAYFVTICAQDRACLFGEIVDDEMRPNAAGLLVGEHWCAIHEASPSVLVDEFVVMPNHLHGILFLTSAQLDTPLSAIVGAFKSKTTHAYSLGVRAHGWHPFHRRVWQRGFFDHIIRDEHSLNETRRCIHDNPRRWASDRDNPTHHPL